MTGHAAVLRGDARHLPLPDASVDLICTSPPYFGLRSYTDDGEHYDGQIGSEATPREWLAAMLECTAEWVRVLKPSGSIFVNLGDKYATAGTRQGQTGVREFLQASQHYGRRPAGFQDKSLMGLPWRYALACMDDLGLILRRDIIWSKPNGLPESVTDRCRSSHEYLFHLVKQPRYYAAVDEIREPHTGNAHMARKDKGPSPTMTRLAATGDHGMRYSNTDPSMFNPLGKLPGSVWDIPSQPLTVPESLGISHFAAFPMELPRRCILGWSPPGICTACGEGRRPVVDRGPSFLSAHPMPHPTAPDGDVRKQRARGQKHQDRKNAHPDQITGYACACTPYTDHPGTGERQLRETYTVPAGGNSRPQDNGRHQAGTYERVGPWREYHQDWTPPPTRPAVVVDPFGGTGTTALVAAMYGRLGFSFDLSADYGRLARWRVTDPAERAKALQVPKPPPVPDGQGDLFDLTQT